MWLFVFVLCFKFFFFFKRKPAYGMRISDWSSDVCSSDLSEARIAVASLSCAGVCALLLAAPRGDDRTALPGRQGDSTGTVARWHVPDSGCGHGGGLYGGGRRQALADADWSRLFAGSKGSRRFALRGAKRRS